MPDTAPKPARRKRRWPIALLALALLAGVAALLLHHYSRPDRLTALLVGQARSQLGLELSVGERPGYSLRPHLQAVLPQLQLKANGQVLLSAQALGATVPWHTLWADRYEIERIELIRPLLDLDVLREWLASRPTSDAATPDVRFALHVEDATLMSAGKPLAEGVNLRFSNGDDLSAWLAKFDAAGSTSLLPPLTGSADAAAIQFGDTRLEDVHVEVRDDAPPAPAAEQR
jgi:hypothetical protein